LKWGNKENFYNKILDNDRESEFSYTDLGILRKKIASDIFPKRFETLILAVGIRVGYDAID